MQVEIAELEQEFRQSWRTYDPGRYSRYLSQADQDKRLELLTRLLLAELEFTFQPPVPVDENETTITDDDDDERVRPSVRLFMLRFPELNRHDESIIRLSVLEYALRLRHDRIPPNPDSYLSLCGQSQEKLIKLLHLTENKLPISRPAPISAGPSDSTIKESKGDASLTLSPLPFNLGCFLLIRMVGKGGMGYVHSAIDLRSTAQVAVKVMRRVDPWSVFRFLEEFTWLSHLNHPNLVKLYDAFSEGDIRYFSMELIEGKTIRQWFQKIPADSPNRINQLRRILAQAASAIHFLHQHGVIHCDIKCSNLMIASKRRAVLLDLGLAVREGNSQPLVGTVQYMAPEVLYGGKPTRAGDWYSFGVLLYEVMADEYPPIQVDLDATETDKKYVLDREKLNSKLSDFDPELADLCAQLLSSNPNMRPSGGHVLQKLGGYSQEDTLVGPIGDFVGRESELEQLDEAYRQSAENLCKVVVVHGESGIGKSCVVQEWLNQRNHTKDLLITVRCYRQDHTPLRLLNLLVQEVVQVLRNQPESVWRSSLDEHLHEIGAAFPQMRQLVEEDFAVTSRPPSAKSLYEVKTAGVGELERWLIQLSQVQPLLLIIDDAQWADKESLQLISKLIAADSFVGLVIAMDEGNPLTVAELISPELARPESAGQNAAHSTLVRSLEIGPLHEKSTVQLLSGWANRNAIDITPSIAKNISQRAGGSPFLLQELFRAYSHYARRDGSSDEQWLNNDSQSNVRRRFSLLPIQSENVLQYLAVAGQSISFHQLQMVSRILPHELQSTLSLLAAQGWVRSRSNDLESDLEIAHENFRQIVLGSMPTERLHRRHFRMARTLSSDVPPPWSRMGEHYWISERYKEAAACYLEAARNAMAASAFRDALFFLQRADHPDADRSSREKEYVTRLRADCLSGFGSSIAAAEIYDELAEGGEDSSRRTLNRCLAGEQLIRAGQLDAGLNRMREVLQTLGITNLRHSLRSRFCFTCRTLKAAVFDRPRALRSVAGENEEFSEMDRCLNRVSVPLTFLHNQLGPDLILRLKKLVEHRGSKSDQSIALLHWGTLLSFAGGRWRHKALSWLSTGRHLARQSGGAAALGSAQLCMFIWHVQRGQPAKAILHGTRAIGWLEREPRNLHWESQFLQWGLLGCYWNTGQLAKLQETTAILRRRAIDRNDAMSQFLMNVGAAHLSDLVADDVPRAQQALQWSTNAISNQTFQSPRFFLWLSRIQQAIYEGHSEEAHQLLQTDWKQLANSYVFSTNHYHWLALCLRMCCNLVHLREGARRRSACLRDTRRSISLLAKLKDPAFAIYGQVFQLVLDSARQKQIESQRWERTICTLQNFGHTLHANALRWHQDLATSHSPRNSFQANHPPTPNGDVISPERTLREQGCQNPAKLLDIIMPLPVHESP